MSERHVMPDKLPLQVSGDAFDQFSVDSEAEIMRENQNCGVEKLRQQMRSSQEQVVLSPGDMQAVLKKFGDCQTALGQVKDHCEPGGLRKYLNGLQPQSSVVSPPQPGQQPNAGQEKAILMLRMMLHEALAKEDGSDPLVGVVFGGPGTGKTWVIKQIQNICMQEFGSSCLVGGSTNSVSVNVGAPRRLAFLVAAAVTENITGAPGKKNVVEHRLKLYTNNDKVMMLDEFQGESAKLLGQEIDRCKQANIKIFIIVGDPWYAILKHVAQTL